MQLLSCPAKIKMPHRGGWWLHDDHKHIKFKTAWNRKVEDWDSQNITLLSHHQPVRRSTSWSDMLWPSPLILSLKTLALKPLWSSGLLSLSSPALACSNCSVAQSRPTLCNPMDYSTPHFPVLHHFLELAETHVHWVSNGIQPSCPLSPIHPCAFYLSQHQGLFQWVSSSQKVTKVLELQHQSYQWIFRIDFLYDWLLWSPCSPRDSQASSTPQFKSINSLALSLLYGPTLISIHDYWKNHRFDYRDFCWQNDGSAL